MIQPGYTGLYSESITQILDNALVEISHDIGALNLPCLAGVVLGGGYGRSEGGLLWTPEDGDQLYNDLDLFVFSRHANAEERSHIDKALEKLGEKWTKRLHVSVDFGPAKNLETLDNISRRLMYQELLHGWRPVWGDISLKDYIPNLPPKALPITEALRLLLNRGMGLVFASEHLHAGKTNEKEETDFIIRNMNKTLLGCGDAQLIAAGRYRWSGFERVMVFRSYARRQEFPPEQALLYEEAYRFKLAPRPVLSQDPWERWKVCRDFWMATVRRVARVSARAWPGTVRWGIHNVARPERSTRNFLRWFKRTRRVRLTREMFDAPVVTMLGRLYDLLAKSKPPKKCPPYLRYLWKFFN